MSSPTKKASEAAAQLVADWDDQNAELEPSLKDMQRLALAIDAHTDAALASRGAVNAELVEACKAFIVDIDRVNADEGTINLLTHEKAFRAALSRASQQPQQRGAGQPPATTGAEGGDDLERITPWMQQNYALCCEIARLEHELVLAVKAGHKLSTTRGPYATELLSLDRPTEPSKGKGKTDAA